MSETHTKTGEGVLVDEVRESPVDKYLLRHRRKMLLILLLIVIVLAVWCYFRSSGDESGQGGASPDYTAGPAALSPEDGAA
jgi:hypothetical protein